MKSLKFAVLLLLFTVAINNAQSKWVYDTSHSTVGFAVSHLVISEVDGKFKKFEGSVTTDNSDFINAQIDLKISVSSIDTENEDRDNHLKAPDFFDAKNHPYITFKSKSMAKVKGNKYKLIGDLTMRGVTKQVSLDVKYNGTVKDPWGNTKAGFKITGELDRFDYGLEFNKLMEAGGAVVGSDIELDINLELLKK